MTWCKMMKNKTVRQKIDHENPSLHTTVRHVLQSISKQKPLLRGDVLVPPPERHTDLHGLAVLFRGSPLHPRCVHKVYRRAAVRIAKLLSY